MVCTLEPLDVLVVPAAWINVQSTVTDKVAGVRRSVIFKNLECCKDASRLLAEVKSLAGVPSTISAVHDLVAAEVASG